MPEKYYNPLSIHIIGFTKFTSLRIITHLITEYAKLEYEDVQDIHSENEGAYFRQNPI